MSFGECLVKWVRRDEISKRLNLQFEEWDPTRVEDGEADEGHDFSSIFWSLPSTKSFVLGSCWRVAFDGNVDANEFYFLREPLSFFKFPSKIVFPCNKANTANEDEGVVFTHREEEGVVHDSGVRP